MTTVVNTIIDTITPFLYQHRYIFAFLGAVLEGTNIMLLAGFLYRLGVFKFWNVFLILFGGYILNGYFFYLLGRWGGRSFLEKWGHHFFLTKERLKKLERYFKKHTVKTLLITRITYGLGAYVFVIAGIFKTKARKFFWCNLFASFVWVSVTFTIGYIFGASYEALSSLIKVVAAWVAVALFILAIAIPIALVFWMRRRAGKKFIESIANHKTWKVVKYWSKKLYKFLDDNV